MQKTAFFVFGIIVFVVNIAIGVNYIDKEQPLLYALALQRADDDHNGFLDASEVWVAYITATNGDGEKMFQKLNWDEMRRLVGSHGNCDKVTEFVASWVQKSQKGDRAFKNYRETPSEFLPKLARFVIDADRDGKVSQTEFGDALKVIYPYSESIPGLVLSEWGPYGALKLFIYPYGVLENSELQLYATRR